MAHDTDNPLDRLLAEYGVVFHDFDDLTLARWMSQTLGQLQGRVLRLSHPLVGAYRLAAQVAHDRSVWLKRLASFPSVYVESACCRAPLLPLLTRDVVESGLVCLHCNDTAVAFDDLPSDYRPMLRGWAEEYAPLHAVAHWDEAQQRRSGDYDRAFEEAAERAETLLAFAGNQVAAALLDAFPAVIWEDQDECLEVRPEDVKL
ncbi:MAG: hypothetical protein H7A45_19195 [Verrucomicrobiales bacterium]|nr:hypothetical protein [Verrucomicrobiales bacterium]MCP5526949.1 hypothetical protein [Verrucomicrobiales bacterium]